MSIFGSPPTPPNAAYGRGDLQAAFNWLVNQPEHIRKQASDPDRLMTLYYRSSGRPEMIKTSRTDSRSDAREFSKTESRIETEAPVSGPTFISDLHQINEALRQFGVENGAPPPATPVATAPFPFSAQAYPAPTVPATPPAPSGIATQPLAPPAPSSVAFGAPTLAGKSLEYVQEMREKLNLSTDAEAANALISMGYRTLKRLID